MNTIRSEESCYRALAAAIIKSAVDDKKLARQRMKKEEYQGIIRKINTIERFLRNNHDISDKDFIKLQNELKDLRGRKNIIERPIREAERFFKSEWFEALSEFINMNPDYMRDRLKAM